MTTAVHEIVKSTEVILASLPPEIESWDVDHKEIAEQTIQALLDSICALHTKTATVRRLRQIEKRALIVDAKEAGEVQ